MTLNGKTVWIVGASSGVGFELTKQLLNRNNVVFASARQGARLEALREEYPEHLRFIRCDVSDDNSIDEAQQALNKATDYLDIAIVCAGICEYEDDLSFDISAYERVMQTNFIGAVRTCKIALPLLRNAKKPTRLVAVGSLSSLAAFSRAELYGASKAAFDYFFQCLMVDLKGSNINVSLVRPGFIDTPLTQKNDFSMPGLMSVEVSVSLIIRGLEKEKRFIQFPFSLAFVLHIAKIFPRLWLEKIAPKLKKQPHNL